MIDGLRPYRETKTTGLTWLPAIPAGWEFHRAKRTFRKVDERSVRGDEELLSVSHITGVTPRSQKNVTMFMAESYEGHKLCRPADIVVNTMWAWMAAVGASRQVGIVSPSYGVYRPRLPDSFIPRFLDYLLRTEVYRAEYVRASRGITTSRLRLYPEDFLGIPFVQPPLEEQKLIARFLDAHGALTARLILAKQRIIKLLEEQKQAVTHRAVTRGLDPNVRLKPSCVPWLGDIPEHWDVVHLRYLVRCLDGQRVPLNGTQRGAMQGPFPYWGANRIIDYVNSWLFDQDLVLLGEDGAPFFEAGRDVSFAVSGRIWVNNHAHVLKCRPRVASSFLATTLNCVDYRNFIDGSTRDKLTQQAMGSIPIQVPELLEQRRIVDKLDRETSGLRHALRVLHGEILLIREFRARLVADVVTGKLDVRAAASALPEITEFEPIDEPADGEDLEEAIDDVENEVVAA